MSNALDYVRSLTVTGAGAKSPVFSVEAYHAMEQRDIALVADELEHGATSSIFVYSFPMDGKTITGVSVIGARHLVAFHGGIKHRIVGSLDKRGSRCTMMTYPHADTPMAVQILDRPEWENMDDWYRVIVEMVDTKTGNSIQVTHEESAWDYPKNKPKFKRPHYTKICESKAYRNAALAIIPQDVVQKFKERAVENKNNRDLTADIIQDRRDGLLTHAVTKGIAVDRQAINRLSNAQLDGLMSAAQTSQESFQRSLEALNVLTKTPEPAGEALAKLPAPKELDAARTSAPRGKSTSRKAAEAEPELESDPDAAFLATDEDWLARNEPPAEDVASHDQRQTDSLPPTRQPSTPSFGGME